jgi:hypothetical protein
MRSISIDLTLEQEVVQTLDAATAGPHRALDYLRGASLLGAAAAACYDALAAKDLAYDTFHGGRVRFCDALPLLGDTPALPVPFGWMRRKDARVAREGRLDASAIHVAPRLAEGAGAGLEQMRGGYFTRAGDLLDFSMSYRLKTAIDRDRRGRPEDAALYGYQALPAGSRWRAWITLDDGVDRCVDAALRAAFDDRAVWLGRSRGAEFGRAHARVGAAPPPETDAVESSAAGRDRLVVYLLSDAVLLDPETGEPTLSPRPEHFGLDARWTLDPLRSSLMTRRSSPFNGKRGRRDLERPAVLRRSVLTFRSGQPGTAADPAGVRRFVDAGVGAHRAEGLGRVLIDPWFLADEQPRFFGESYAPSPPPRLAPPGPLARWMVERHSARTHADLAEARALEAARVLTGLARRIEPAHLRPTRSQWHRLAHLVRAHQDHPLNQLREALESELFGIGDGAGVASNTWRAEVAGKPLWETTLALGLGDPAWDDARRIACLYQTAFRAAEQTSKDREAVQ